MRRTTQIPIRGRIAQADRRRQRLPGGERKADGTLLLDEAAEKERVDRLHERKAKRDGEAVRRLLGQVRRVAATKENLLPTLIEAAQARCTVGEIMPALADVFGRYEGAARW